MKRLTNSTRGIVLERLALEDFITKGIEDFEAVTGCKIKSLNILRIVFENKPGRITGNVDRVIADVALPASAPAARVPFAQRETDLESEA